MSRVWFNGSLIEGPLALAAHDRGLLLGDGLFETMLVVNRTALWSNMHLARLEASAKELGIAFAREVVDDALAQLLDGISDRHHALRITLTRGAAMRGLGATGGFPTLLIMLDPFDARLMFQPAALVTSTIARNAQAPSSRLKTTSYVDNICAAREAASRGMDDALMLNTQGHAACSTIANLFLLKGTALVTPSRDQGILTGVTRQTLIAAAASLSMNVEERAVEPAELMTVDGVFLTNSLRFIRPVKALDGQALPQTDLSLLVNALCETARLQCGRDPRLI